MVTRVGVRKGNNAGLVIVAAVFPAYQLLHTLPIGRTVKIRKVMWYNNTGANITFILGTETNVPAWLPLFPTILAINGFDGELNEEDLPDVEFANDRTAGAAGRTGSIHVQASAINLQISLEVEEFGR